MKGFSVDCKEDENIIDLAIKEVIDDRDRIHTINLECARKIVFKEAMKIYTELKNFEHNTEVKKAYEKDIQNLITYLFLEFERKLNTNNTEKLKEGKWKDNLVMECKK